MNRLQQISEKIQEFPVPTPVYKVETDWSGDLRFRKHNHKVENPYENPDAFEKLIDSNICRSLQRDESNKHYYTNNVEDTLSGIMSNVISTLQNSLREALPNVDPKRTKIYKWFRGYRPKTDKEKELVLAIYNYLKTNPECTDSDTKQAEAFVGLIHHIRGTHG